jgi:hypothetical protein
MLFVEYLYSCKAMLSNYLQVDIWLKYIQLNASEQQSVLSNRLFLKGYCTVLLLNFVVNTINYWYNNIRVSWNGQLKVASTQILKIV